MTKEITDRADALRKRQQYSEAAVFYEDAWQKDASPYIGRWLIYCRRKAGDLNGAATIAAMVLDRFPNQPLLTTEYAWIFYDSKVKEARERGELEGLITCAEEALGLSTDELLITRVAQSVVKLAKNQPQPPWEVIAKWAAMINPERLSDRKRITGDGKSFMSEREEWFVGLARALMETGRYGEARRMAQDGLKQFPGEIFLLRTSALALFRGGDSETGAAEMRALCRLPRCDWYMKAELAEMESCLGRTEEAYRLICEALENRQDDKFKLHYFEVLADLALRLEKPVIAASHVTLAGAIRMQEGWKKPTTLEELEERTRAVLVAAGEEWPTFPGDVRELSRHCRKLRQNDVREGEKLGTGRAGTENRPGGKHRIVEMKNARETICGEGKTEEDFGADAASLGRRHTGTITKFDPERPFTFIKPDGGGEAVFVSLRELPTECARTGARVSYRLEEGFDRKKNRASVRAAGVTPA